MEERINKDKVWEEEIIIIGTIKYRHMFLGVLTKLFASPKELWGGASNFILFLCYAVAKCFHVSIA